MNKNLQLILIAVLIIFCGLMSYYFFFFVQNEAEEAAQRECPKLGVAAVDKYKIDNKTETISGPLFQYNSAMKKCYVYIEVAPYGLCDSGRLILDVKENKEVLSACFTDKGIKYFDATQYPEKIIDQTEFIMQQNNLMENHR